VKRGGEGEMKTMNEKCAVHKMSSQLSALRYQFQLYMSKLSSNRTQVTD